MNKYFIKSIFTVVLLLFISTFSFASHNMGADLTFNHVSGNTFQFRLAYYRYCSGINAPSSVTVNISSASLGISTNTTLNLLGGSGIEVSPVCASQLSQSTCNGGSLPGVQQYIYQGSFTMPGNATDWIISYSDCCRNSAVTNITNGAGIYIQAIMNNLDAPTNNSPDFTTLPVPYLCNNVLFAYNNGTFDIEGDLLVYDLIDPMDAANNPIGRVFGTATQPFVTSPANGTVLDANTGTMTFTPSGLQNAVVAIRVREYRNGVLISTIMRDMQVVVLNCTNNSPVLSSLSTITNGSLSNGVISTCAGATVSFQVTGTDVDASNSLSLAVNFPGTTVTQTGTNPAVFTVTVPTLPNSTGSYALTLRLTDGNCPFIGSSTVAYPFVVEGVDAVFSSNIVNCVSQPQTLNLSATFANGLPSGASVTWSPSTYLQSTSGQSVNLNLPANATLPITYTLTYINGGCTSSFDYTLALSTVGAVTGTLATPQSVCAANAGRVTVTAVGGTAPYSYSGGAAFQNSNELSSLNANGTTITIRDINGCTATLPVSIPVETISVTASSSSTTLCDGQSAQLLATPSGAFSNSSGNNYTVRSIPYASYPTTGTQISLSDDQVSGVIPIGFSFSFYGQSYTDAYVSSNGFISFNPSVGNGCCSGQVIPNNSTNLDNLIALAWNDLYPPGAGNVTYNTIGIAPNRIFVVSYNNVAHCCGSAPPYVDGQILLYEGSNRIELQIRSIVNDGSAMTQGITNSGGTLGTAVSGRNSSDWGASNEGWLFSNGPVYTYNWSNGSSLDNAVLSSPVASPTATTSYSVTATSEAGCSGVATVNVANNSTRSTTNVTINSGSYTWTVTGQTYTSAGVYTATSTNANGCLHTTTLNLLNTATIPGNLPCNFRYFWPQSGAVVGSTNASVSCYSVLGNNIGATGNNEPTDCGASGDKGVWYFFRMPGCGSGGQSPLGVKISTNNSGTTLAGTSVAVYSVTNSNSCSRAGYANIGCSTNSSVAGCNGTATGTHGTLEFGPTAPNGQLMADGNYFIYVSGINGSEGNYELSFEYTGDRNIIVTAGPSQSQAILTVPNNGQGSFRPQWRPMGSTGWASTSSLASGNSFTLPANTLMPGVNYEFRVLYACASTYNYIMSSNVVNFATTPNISTCGPVTGLSCNSVAGNVSMTWSTAPVGTIGNLVIVARSGATQLSGTVVSSTATSVTFACAGCTATNTSFTLQSICGGAGYIASRNCVSIATGNTNTVQTVSFEHNGIVYEDVDFNDPSWGLFGAQPTGNFTMSVANGQLIVNESIVAKVFDFELRPSVATDFTNVVISTQKTVDAQLSLSNMNGTLVSSQMLKGVQNGTVVTLETSELAAGLYIVSVRTEEGNVAKKLIKIN